MAIKAKIKNQSLNQPSFSKSILLIFALVFAGIGGYAIFRSFAASPLQFSCGAVQPDLNMSPTNTSQTPTDVIQIGQANQAVRNVAKSANHSANSQLINQIKSRKQRLIKL